MEPSQGEIIQKPKMQELPSLFMTHHINVMHALVKFHEYIPYSLGVMARTPFTIWNLVKGKIIQKQKRQELSSLFMTHRINVMHALVKCHEYIPYGLGVMARTRLTIWNLVKGK